jgi:hypothetical protein
VASKLDELLERQPSIKMLGDKGPENLSLEVSDVGDFTFTMTLIDRWARRSAFSPPALRRYYYKATQEQLLALADFINKNFRG